MPITKNKPPTDAQARKLAYLWGASVGVKITVRGWIDPTMKVLLARGWLVKTGATGTYPDAVSTWVEYRISPEGVGAMADYFINKAHGK